MKAENKTKLLVAKRRNSYFYR